MTDRLQKRMPRDLMARIERRAKNEVRLHFPTMTVTMKDIGEVSDERVWRTLQEARRNTRLRAGKDQSQPG